MLISCFKKKLKIKLYENQHWKKLYISTFNRENFMKIELEMTLQEIFLCTITVYCNWTSAYTMNPLD